MRNYILHSTLLAVMTLSSLSTIAQVKDYRIDAITSRIVRVRVSFDSDIAISTASNNTGVCNYDAMDPPRQGNIRVQLTDNNTKMVFMDRNNNVLLTQDFGAIKAEPVVQERVVYDEASAHTVQTANGEVTVKDVIRRDTIGKSTRFTLSFKDNATARYGLGCQENDYLNLRGKAVWLTQHNLKVQIPMLLTTGGYALLFDAGCAMKYESPEDDPSCYTVTLEAAHVIDYYFINGQKLNEQVSHYRYLTGYPSMMPRYIFGFTQSKERYTSSDDILSTLKEYRRRHVPVDMMVQDWNYWPQGWGYMKMDPKYYPSPKALADSVHALGAKLMVSIWPNPQGCPEADDFKAKGMMLEHDVYDAFNPDARKLYWKYANDEFFSNGFDAWWCDSSEPLDDDWNTPPAAENGVPYSLQSYERRWQLNKDILSESLGAERSSLYSLYHSAGIWENQINTDRNKRVVNLTRSSFAGQQRYGTIVWNGDTHASWESFRQQIPAGLNYMATGNPYWTVDAGSFFTKNDGKRWFYNGDFPGGAKSDAYREYYTRMMQWTAFLPMMRSHGTDTPREIWQFGEPGTPYYDAILKMINLRYQHVPYIYSMAFYQSCKYHSMARLLAFDFPQDSTVLDMKDEYMFGDYLVCPVTHPLSETTVRKVYLPKDTNWTDYWTGKKYKGGQWLECKSEIDKLPLFVRQGSIIPTTEVADNTEEQVGKIITINVYPGHDASFMLYMDSGDGYLQEHGDFSAITMEWDDRMHTLKIDQSIGLYIDSLNTQKFIVKTPYGTSDVITYNGAGIKVMENKSAGKAKFTVYTLQQCAWGDEEPLQDPLYYFRGRTSQKQSLPKWIMGPGGKYYDSSWGVDPRIPVGGMGSSYDYGIEKLQQYGR